MQGSSQKPPSAVVENSGNATRSNLQLQLKQKKTAELRKEISKLSQTIQKKTRNSEANLKGNPYPRAPQQAAANQDKHFCFNFQRFGVCDKRKCTLNHDPQKVLGVQQTKHEVCTYLGLNIVRAKFIFCVVFRNHRSLFV